LAKEYSLNKQAARKIRSTPSKHGTGAKGIMVMEFTPSYQRLVIECEKQNINFYAQEIGFFKKLLEKEENDTTRQWFSFFRDHAEIELEQANGRLEEFRKQLTEWESLQRAEEDGQPLS
jgi:hypothetical protein